MKKAVNSEQELLTVLASGEQGPFWTARQFGESVDKFADRMASEKMHGDVYRESTEPETLSDDLEADLRKPDADGIVDLEYNEETGVWE